MHLQYKQKRGGRARRSGSLTVIQDGQAVRTLAAGRGVSREDLARRILEAAEAERLPKPRPERMAAALAAAYARELPEGPFERRRDAVLQRDEAIRSPAVGGSYLCTAAATRRGSRRRGR
jgi:hypothetical protein